MSNKAETVRGVLAAMGYGSDRVDAAITALDGIPVSSQRDEPLLTPQQLCDRLKISITSLWRLGPPFIRVGGRKRYDWLEVKRFLAVRQEQMEG